MWRKRFSAEDKDMFHVLQARQEHYEISEPRDFKMPLFRLETNVSRSKITPEFLKETTAVMSKTLGRGQEFCVAEVIPDLPMCWGGTNAPGGNAIFMAIGLMGEEENKRHAAALFKHINKHLGIPEDRGRHLPRDKIPSGKTSTMRQDTMVEDIYHATRYHGGRHLSRDKIPSGKTSTMRQDTMVEDIYHKTRYHGGRHLGRDKIPSWKTFRARQDIFTRDRVYLRFSIFHVTVTLFSLNT
uniref:L-dopachrome isomerase n=1 Tax=Timema monikensis TaxID=170555 RepID=A0A7R9EGB3_9NEOP|nr:unnamed protein product [Timema monikensis]